MGHLGVGRCGGWNYLLARLGLVAKRITTKIAIRIDKLIVFSIKKPAYLAGFLVLFLALVLGLGGVLNIRFNTSSGFGNLSGFIYQ